MNLKLKTSTYLVGYRDVMIKEELNADEKSSLKK